MLASLLLLCLSIAAVVAAVAVLFALRTVLRCGPGAVQENLDSTRKAGRMAGASILILLGSLSGLVILAGMWAQEWRASMLGLSVLNTLLGMFGVALLYICGQVTFNQWSSRGSTKGLVVWTVAGLVIGAIFILVGYWRSG